MPIINVEARGESHPVPQVAGNLFVCTKENGSCCCGWEVKGRMPFANELWAEEWERRGVRNRVHLTFSGCLGPCATGNNALLLVAGRATWFKDLNSPGLVPLVFDYLEALLDQGEAAPVPAGLQDHVFERYGEGGGTPEALAPDIDPVCFMRVDPATAVHRATYRGREVLFCAPSCRKQFLADPARFLADG